MINYYLYTQSYGGLMNSQSNRVVALGVAVFLLSMAVFANNMNAGGQKCVVRSMSSYTLGLTGLNVGGIGNGAWGQP